MKPKIYKCSEYQINLKNIDPHVYYIIEKLKSKGYKAYLVGGSVRDLLLKAIPKDFDIATSALPNEIKAVFQKNCILIGKRFRLAHIRFGRKIFEVSTFRSGDLSTKELIKRDNEWGSEEEDVLRRDFTINGLYLDTEKEIILDYVGGVEDAKKNLLKAIGDPKIRFIQDPVRMIRLLKFKARFDFNIDPQALAALDEVKEEIKKSSQMRIFEEIYKMLISGNSASFFKLLYNHNFLGILFNNISNYLKKYDDLYLFLETIDSYNKKHFNKMLKKEILFSTLLFPLLDRHLKEKEFQKINLGTVADEARKLIAFTFDNFFHIPRKLKAMVISTLTNQYRILPLKPTSFEKIKVRIPKDPFFTSAMKFFSLRSSIDPSLLPMYNKWHKYLVSHHKKRYNKRVKSKKIIEKK